MPGKTIYNNCCTKKDIHFTYTTNSLRMSTAQKEANMIRQQPSSAGLASIERTTIVVPPRNIF